MNVERYKIGSINDMLICDEDMRHKVFGKFDNANITGSYLRAACLVVSSYNPENCKIEVLRKSAGL